MQYTINELRQKIFNHVYDVYEIFQNFFEPQFVDLQEIPTDEDLIAALQTWDIEESEYEHTYEVSPQRLGSLRRSYSTLKPSILVYWPRVTVTNENDRSVQIQDLYAKVILTTEGRIPYECRGFKLNRTTFSEVQFASGYLHSHIPHIRDDQPPHFDNPCLGTGPINNTIMDLKNGYEETLWMLFCQELALYVTVESLRGGPYFRMEQIGSEHRLYGYDDYNGDGRDIAELGSFTGVSSYHQTYPQKFAEFKEIVKHFTLYYLEHGHLSLNYKDGQFVQGMPYFDYMIDISNSFIDFFNQYGHREDVQSLYERKIIIKAMVSNSQFFENRAISHHDYTGLEGQDMFEFKGEMKHLHIEMEAEAHREVTLLLNHKIAMFILHNVLKIINYRYRNEHNNNAGTGSNTAVIAPTYQTVVYL